jgi:hypothetical protein
MANKTSTFMHIDRSDLGVIALYFYCSTDDALASVDPTFFERKAPITCEICGDVMSIAYATINYGR